ncbi:MAG: sigma-70 family RNA polymerase sigma factor [Acidimicrobiales bacterium]|nr:sigma-70 family RNA polymerase sigma factor [Acidimicrobiales bacterium]RZV48772.1 MAG: sigma-70 family RNA polymerase sigma factor [Acidimicrobiales bacterium]
MTTEAAFDEMFRRFEPNVYAYCARRFSPSLAEDVTAEVFGIAWAKFDDAPFGGEALPWLYRIAFLTASNQRRRLGARRRYEEGFSPIRRTTAVSDHVVVRDELRAVLDGLERLRSKDQEVLRLAAWEGLETSEIATVLGVKPDAAAQRLHRARERLAREVASRTGGRRRRAVR